MSKMKSCGYGSALLVLLAYIPASLQHGRLTVPPGRSTAWRYGFDTPRNDDDNELNCGGFARQWSQNGGNCGECGDPWDLPLGERENQVGGEYATGTIVATYTMGQTIDVEVEINAQHHGWYEFRLCAVNDKDTPVTWDCLNQNLLRFSGGSTRYYIPESDGKGFFTFSLQLPSTMSCSQCVLQWMWHCGNSWGQFPNGTACVGCGAQEQFYGCADVTILGNGETAPPTSSPATTTTTTSAPTTTVETTTTTAPPTGGDCVWIGTPGLGDDNWCMQNCKHTPPNCPPDKCQCSGDDSGTE